MLVNISWLEREGCHRRLGYLSSTKNHRRNVFQKTIDVRLYIDFPTNGVFKIVVRDAKFTGRVEKGVGTSVYMTEFAAPLNSCLTLGPHRFLKHHTRENRGGLQ